MHLVRIHCQLQENKFTRFIQKTKVVLLKVINATQLISNDSFLQPSFTSRSAKTACYQFKEVHLSVMFDLLHPWSKFADHTNLSYFLNSGVTRLKF